MPDTSTVPITSTPTSLIRNLAHTDPQAFVQTPLVQAAAALSSYVYGGVAAVPVGYTALNTAENPFGFRSAAFQNTATGDIVVAVRGTTNDTASLISDVGFAAGMDPLTQASVDQLTQQIGALRAAYPDAHITLTGHSLGAGIAILVGAGSGINVIGFNAPQLGSVVGSYSQSAIAAADAANAPGDAIQDPGFLPAMGYNNIVTINNQYDPVHALPLGGAVGETITVAAPENLNPLVSHSITTLVAALANPQVLDHADHPTPMGKNFLGSLAQPVQTLLGSLRLGPDQNTFDMQFLHPAAGGSAAGLDLGATAAIIDGGAARLAAAIPVYQADLTTTLRDLVAANRPSLLAADPHASASLAHSLAGAFASFGVSLQNTATLSDALKKVITGQGQLG